jgi:hypothetical protein
MGLRKPIYSKTTAGIRQKSTGRWQILACSAGGFAV